RKWLVGHVQPGAPGPRLLCGPLPPCRPLVDLPGTSAREFSSPQHPPPCGPHGRRHGLVPARGIWMNSALPAYAELHCLSNFSFQRGASHPHELVDRACKLGYEALAITDECSVAGVVRAHVGLKEYLEALEPAQRPTMRLLFGSEFAFERFRLVA